MKNAFDSYECNCSYHNKTVTVEEERKDIFI